MNGKAVTPSVYSRVSALGVDRTDTVRAAGLPLNPASFEMGEALRNLAPETIDQLHRLGLLVVEDWGIQPAWQFETSFYWEMTFPAGEEVLVEHSYQPVVGFGSFGDFQLDDPTYLERYCMDESFHRRCRATDGNRPGLPDARRTPHPVPSKPCRELGDADRHLSLDHRQG